MTNLEKILWSGDLRYSYEFLEKILWSKSDPRYSYEFYCHAPKVASALEQGAITIEEEKIPSLPSLSPEEDGYLKKIRYEFHHDPEVHEIIVRTLWFKFKSNPRDCIKPNVRYSSGICDIALVKNDCPIFAVEIGDTRADKPIGAFYNEQLKELWVVPFETIEQRVDSQIYYLIGSPVKYYIFRRGKNWQEFVKKRDEERLRNLKNLPSRF